MSEWRVRLTRVGNSTPVVKRYARDEANRPKRVIFCGYQNGEWRAREENLGNVTPDVVIETETTRLGLGSAGPLDFLEKR